ncbi:hypothetical protein [Bifidobacterium sp. ESL0827]|uniref:hypothetical protein n=1 Tax=Bifidobacterium sp. ESL0827 TaxID=3448583 RepID=UPI00404253EF
MKERILVVRASLPSHLLTGFDSTVAGKKTIIVAYCGANASFGIWAKARGQNASGTETEGLHGKHSSLDGPSHTVMTHLGTSIISVASLVGTLVLTSFGALFGRRYQSSKR